MSPSQASQQPARYAMLLEKDLTSPEEEGYLLVDVLDSGGCSSGVFLVRSVQTSKLYVRKFHSAATNADDVYRTIVTEFCDGGSCQEWFDTRATPENSEFMAWLVAIEVTRALAYLHSDNATHQGGIWHNDVHCGNVFLHFGDQTIPKVLLGDFGLSDHQHNSEDAGARHQNVAYDLSIISKLRMELDRYPLDPPIGMALLQLFSIFPDMKGIDSAEELLQSIEQIGATRMELLEGQPGFSITRPAVSDGIPMLFNNPQIIGPFARNLRSLPRNVPGEPGWRWVKMDLNDQNYRSFEMMRNDPSPAGKKVAETVAFFEKLGGAESTQSAG